MRKSRSSHEKLDPTSKQPRKARPEFEAAPASRGSPCPSDLRLLAASPAASGLPAAPPAASYRQLDVNAPKMIMRPAGCSSSPRWGVGGRAPPRRLSGLAVGSPDSMWTTNLAIARATAPAGVGSHAKVCRHVAGRRCQQLQRHVPALSCRISLRARASRSSPARTVLLSRLEVRATPLWMRDGVLGPIRLEAFLSTSRAASRPPGDFGGVPSPTAALPATLHAIPWPTCDMAADEHLAPFGLHD